MSGLASLTEADREALRAYSECRMTAIELRRRLGDATYGEVLMLLGEAGLPLPRAPVQGREAEIARAREWMFPKDDESYRFGVGTRK